LYLVPDKLSFFRGDDIRQTMGAVMELLGRGAKQVNTSWADIFDRPVFVIGTAIRDAREIRDQG